MALAIPDRSAPCNSAEEWAWGGQERIHELIQPVELGKFMGAEPDIEHLNLMMFGNSLFVLIPGSPFSEPAGQ